MDGPITIRRARDDERSRVLAVHLAPLLKTDDAIASKVAELMESHERGELVLNGLIVAEAGDAIRGTAVYSLGRDRVAILWLPVSNDQSLRRRLLQATVAFARDDGCVLVQSTLPQNHGETALLDGVLHNYTDLVFLSQTRPFRPPGPFIRANISAIPFTSDDRDRFAGLLADTFIGSRDCPELRGLLTAEQSLAGIEQTGTSRSAHWWRFEDETGEDVGLVLAAAQPALNAWEIAYVGVRPRFRGRGKGRTMLTDVMQRPDVPDTVLMAVSLANRPALNLYRSLGFVAFDRQEVWLDRAFPTAESSRET